MLQVAPELPVSMPEQKALPAPVSTMHATESSPARCVNASASSTRRSIDSALRLSGRCNVTSATAPRGSIVNRPGMGRTAYGTKMPCTANSVSPPVVSASPSGPPS